MVKVSLLVLMLLTVMEVFSAPQLQRRTAFTISGAEHRGHPNLAHGFRGRRRPALTTTWAARAQEAVGALYSKDRVGKAAIDFLVIGSGVGGLWLAAALSKLRGYRCVVLEQHYVAGGLNHAFTHRGYEFPPGIHYLANREVCEGMLNLVADPAHPVEWVEQGAALPADHQSLVSHEVKIGDLPLMSIARGTGRIIEELLKHFPEEERGIREWIEVVEEAKWLPGIWANAKGLSPFEQQVMIKLLCGRYLEFASLTSEEAFKRFSANPKLATVLSAFSGDLGETLREGSFVMQAAVMGHIAEGCWFPKGGPIALARAMVPTIRAAGGDVFVRAPVAEILVNDAGEAYGVRLENGDELNAVHGVVSAAGMLPTVERLLAPSAVERFMPEQAALIRHHSGGGIAHVFAFVGLNGSPEELGLKSASFYYIPWDEERSGPMEATRIQEHFRKSLLDPNEPQVSAGMVFPSAKDPAYSNETMPGKSTCVIFSEAVAEDFKALAEEEKQGRRRSEAYLAAKKVVEEKLRRSLLANFPQLEGKIEVFMVGTPCSSYTYLRRFESLGLRHTPARMTEPGLRADTPIKGLFFSGQDVAFAGWAGALNGAMVAVQRILGYSLLDMTVGKDLLSDLGGSDLMISIAKKSGLPMPPGLAVRELLTSVGKAFSQR